MGTHSCISGVVSQLSPIFQWCGLHIFSTRGHLSSFLYTPRPCTTSRRGCGDLGSPVCFTLDSAKTAKKSKKTGPSAIRARLPPRDTVCWIAISIHAGERCRKRNLHEETPHGDGDARAVERMHGQLGRPWCGFTPRRRQDQTHCCATAVTAGSEGPGVLRRHDQESGHHHETTGPREALQTLFFCGSLARGVTWLLGVPD